MSAAFASMVAVFVAASLIRVPVAFAMLASGAAYLLVSGQDTGLLAEQVLNGLYSSYVLMAVPLFIFAANVMNAGTISERLFEFAHALVGRFRGGLAQVDVLVSVIFAGISGSAIADAAGPGMVSIRMMTDKGRYRPAFASAVVAASATIGPIIPPSIPMVLYALVSGTSIGALFLGGVVPGLLMALALMAGIAVIARWRGFPTEPPVALRALPRVVLGALLPLSIPVVLLGGLYSGVFTPTEAAAVAAFYALVLASVVYRALGLRQLFDVLASSLRTSAVVTAIIAGAFIVNYAMSAERIPAAIAAWLDGVELSALGFVIAVNALFLVLGCFLDTTVMLLVIVPLLLPSAKLLGIDLVWFGVVVIVNMMIGLVTPPYGVLLFVLNGLSGAPLGEMIREILPFIGLLLAALALMIAFPQIVLWLPGLFGYRG